MHVTPNTEIWWRNRVGRKVYLAGPWDDRAMMPSIAKLFEDAGFEITHKWWEHEKPAGDNKVPDPNFARICAVQDYNGVCNADVLVLLNSSYSEGKAVELGLAMAWSKPIVVIGREKRNVFLSMGLVHTVDFPHEALEFALNAKGK